MNPTCGNALAQTQCSSIHCEDITLAAGLSDCEILHESSFLIAVVWRGACADGQRAGSAAGDAGGSLFKTHVAGAAEAGGVLLSTLACLHSK